jgi:hypothetical protein
LELPTNDPSKNLPFSNLLIDVSIWEWLTFDNGDTNTIVPPITHHSKWTSHKWMFQSFPH